jgi:ABC-type sugar transport system substrate-binding protein
MKRHAVAILTFILCISLVLVGCGSQSSNGNNKETTKNSGDGSSYIYKTKKEGDIVIGFSQSVMDHPFRIANVESAKKAAKELGVELIVTDGQGDVNKEISNIESLIARNVDAIIVSSLSGKAIYPAYKQIAQAEIPLIIGASGVPDDPEIPYVSYVATDEVTMGKKAAEYIAKLMGEEGNLVILDGVTESTNSILRSEGFMPEIEKHSNIKVVAQQSGEWLRLPSMEVMTNILQANDKIDVVFAQNDEMAFGAIEAIKKAGRSDEVKIIGMDAQKEALEMIKNTDQYVMSVKNEWDMKTAVKLAIDAVRGKEVPKRVELDAPLIDDSNIADFYDPESVF